MGEALKVVRNGAVVDVYVGSGVELSAQLVFEPQQVIRRYVENNAKSAYNVN